VFNDFNKIYKKVNNRFFIVNAPIALRDSEYDHEVGIVSHGGKKYDPNRRTNFGLNIIKMSEAFRDGLGFTLYDRSELKELIDIMHQYVIATDKSRRAINFRRFDTDIVSLVYDFGVNVIDLNKEHKIDTNKDIKRVMNKVGGVNPTEILNKIKQNKQQINNTNKQYKESSIIKRPKPLEF